MDDFLHFLRVNAEALAADASRIYMCVCPQTYWIHIYTAIYVYICVYVNLYMCPLTYAKYVVLIHAGTVQVNAEALAADASRIFTLAFKVHEHSRVYQVC